jgi:hypothetical protein
VGLDSEASIVLLEKLAVAQLVRKSVPPEKRKT